MVLPAVLMVLQGKSQVYNFYFACTCIEICSGGTKSFPSGEKVQVCTTM